MTSRKEVPSLDDGETDLSTVLNDISLDTALDSVATDSLFVRGVEC